MFARVVRSSSRVVLAGSAPPPLTPTRAAAATMLGFWALALCDALLGPVFYWPGSISRLAARNLWGTAAMLLCGAAFALLIVVVLAATQRVTRPAGPRVRSAAQWFAIAAASAGVAATFLPDALDLAAHTVAPRRYAKLVLVLFVVFAGIGIAAAMAVGRATSRRTWLRWVAVALAMAAMYQNFLILSDDYPELHCAIGWTVAVLFGFASASLIDWVAARRRLAWSLGGVSIGLSLFALVVPAPNSARLDLFRSAASAAWPLGMVVWRLPDLAPPSIPAQSAEWYKPREGAAPIPPTPRDAPDEAPVVVLVTVDAFRGDLLRDRKFDVLWPTLAKLRDESVYFTHARSPGSQTAVSMTTLFTGRYFSQLYWSKFGLGRSRLDYPVRDKAVRFPALLTDAGVDTFKVCSLGALADEFGLASGFAEEDVVGVGRAMASAHKVMSPLLAHLATADEAPHFLFTHLLDAHGPYFGGIPFMKQTAVVSQTGSPRMPAMYLGALMAVDRAIAGLLVEIDKPRLAGRTLLILSADHGEAFGEHGYTEHAKSLHEELLDIPLLIHGKGLAPRVVDEPVGLIDLGPTILDWFQQPTPGTFMGQSLVPLLLQRPSTLTRPLVAEGRLRRALVLDGFKLIVDERRKVTEAYDLRSDPRETRNLWDLDRSQLTDVSGALHAFFDVHQLRTNGYQPPFRR